MKITKDELKDIIQKEIIMALQWMEKQFTFQNAENKKIKDKLDGHKKILLRIQKSVDDLTPPSGLEPQRQITPTEKEDEPDLTGDEYVYDGDDQ